MKCGVIESVSYFVLDDSIFVGLLFTEVAFVPQGLNAVELTSHKQDSGN